MPTIARLGAVRVVVYPNDHRPAHVHLIGADSEAIFNLNCPDGPPELRENFGFSFAALRKLKIEMTGMLADLCTEWGLIHDAE
jgi:hypothetical protein